MLLLSVAASAIMVARTGLVKTPGRTFAFRYTASFDRIPAAARRVRIWIPLAKTRANQQVLARRVRASVPYEIHQDPIFGDDLLYVALSAPMPQPLEVVIDYTVTVGRTPSRDREWIERADTVAAASERSANLRDEPMMVVNSAVAQLAQEAAAGRRTDLEKARAIYDYVLAHMRYDKTAPGWGRGDTARACQLGAGNCTDFHSLLISMDRAVGIPSRFAIGATVPPQPGPIAGYHCWAEMAPSGHDWMQVDASEAWKHPEKRGFYFGSWDPDKFLISVGRNLQLAPAQAGPPVNYLVHPYVEADDQPVEGITARFESHNIQEGT